jgi:hypothetical protein
MGAIDDLGVEPFMERTGVVWGGCCRLRVPIAQPKCLVKTRVNEERGSRNALAASCSGFRRRWAIGTTLPRFRYRSELSMWPTGLMPPTAARVAVGGVSEVSATMGTVSMLRSCRRALGQWLLGRGIW